MVVSVIIPNYNHSFFLGQRIESVLNQTYQNFEVIILDDCSTDNSIELIEQYRNHPKISKIIYNDRNSGSPFLQWKKGVEYVKGKYIWIAESDDWASEDFLKKLVSNIEKDNSIALSYCRSFKVDGENKVLGVYDWGSQLDGERWNHSFVNEGIDEIKKFLRFMNTIPNASAVLFRSEYGRDVINSLPEEMTFCGDWLFWLRLINGYKISFLSEPLNFFRRHSSTSITWKDPEKERKRIQEYFNVINEACEISEKKISSGINRYDWILNEWYGKRKKVKNLSDFYFPPFPTRLLLRFYYLNIKNNLLNIYRHLKEK